MSIQSNNAFVILHRYLVSMQFKIIEFIYCKYLSFYIFVIAVASNQLKNLNQIKNVTMYCHKTNGRLKSVPS